MNRKTSLLSKEVGDLLIKQVVHELRNFTLYTSFANFFSLEGLDDLNTYYNKRAAEEKLHYGWIVEYLTDCDYRLVYPTIEPNSEQEVETLITPFIATVEREIETTQMLYAIYEKAQSEKDYMTASWLYAWLIKEQIEEENTSRMARTIMEQDGDLFIKAKKVLQLLGN